MSSTENISKFIKTFVFYLLLGVLYSVLFTVLARTLLHFLPILSLLHSILLGSIFGFIGVSVHWLKINNLYPYSIIFFTPIGIHFAIWLRKFVKSIPVNFSLLSLFVVLGISSVIVVLLLWIDNFVIPKTKLSYISITLIFLLGLNYIGLSLAPTTLLLKNSNLYEDIKESKPDNPILNLFYPLQRSFPSGLKDYQPILPEIPKGNKIIVLAVDALRPDYVSKTLHNQEVAPALSKLSNKNLNFQNFRTQASWTKPSIASLFTGKYVREHETFWGKTGPHPNKYKGHTLPNRFTTLAERLQKKNYRTMGTVKSGHLSARYNYDQGFELYLDLLNGYRGDFNSHKQVLFWLYHTTPKKAFVYIHINGPHQPFDLSYLNISFLANTPYYSGRKFNIPGRFTFTKSDQHTVQQKSINLTNEEVQYLRTLYATKLNLYDRYYIREFTDTLKAIDLYDNSLLAVTADHGEGLYEHGKYAHGKNLYEEIIRIPLIMKFPNDYETTVKNTDLNTELVDFTATLLDYASAPTDGISGTSFLPLVKKKSKQNRNSDRGFKYAFSEHAKHQPYVPLATIIAPPWKYIHSFEDGSGELYNIQNDPFEQNTIKDKESTKSKLKEILFRELRSDSSINQSKSRIKESTDKGFKQFKDLGYVQ